MHSRSLRAAIAAALSVSLSGCIVLPKFRPGAPVEVEERALGHAYKQDGKMVDAASLFAGLEAVEAARVDAQSARRWTAAGNILGAVGGATLGWGLGTGLGGDQSGWPIAGVGAGVTAVALVVGTVADARLARAVGAYNAATTPAPTALVVPWAGTIAGAQDRCFAAGVAARF